MLKMATIFKEQQIRAISRVSCFERINTTDSIFPIVPCDIIYAVVFVRTWRTHNILHSHFLKTSVGH